MFTSQLDANKENAAIENITYYMNKCMAKQVAVEECFRTYNDNPGNPISCYDEYEAYTSCLGSESTIISTSKSEKLNQLISTNSEGTANFIEDENMPGRFVFVGSSPNNYLKFGNKLARIISVESDGKIKAIFVDKYSNLQFDVDADITANSGKTAWSNSSLIAALKNKTTGISYSDLFVQGKFYTGTITESNTPQDAITAIISESYENNTYKVGVVSLYDYVIASSAGTCNPNSTSDTFLNMISKCKDNNWITAENTNCSWTTTGIVSSGKIDKYVTIDKTNIYNKTEPNSRCEAGLVFYLSSNTVVDKSGTGTNTNPYIVVF